MSSFLQSILDKVQQADKLSDEERELFIKIVKDAQKNQTLLEFKLDRVEKDKHTLTIMLEESIQDLQKKSKAIEAQKRELEIEAALERVRTRTMAMQKSDELQDVAHMVFETLKELKVELYTAIIVVFSENSKDIFWWLENKEKFQYPKIFIKYADIPYLSELFQARQRGDEIFSKCYSGDEKREIYNYLFEKTDLIDTPLEQKKHLLENEIASFSIALAKNIGIHITSYSRKSFSDEENEILKKTAKVFDQAYTRFLDLQNAEAQAREARIEAALEKVRARTMAMQRSDELSETSSLVFQQLKELGETVSQLSIAVINENDENVELWATVHGEPLLKKYKVPVDDPFVLKKVVNALRAKQKSVTVVLEKDETKAYNDWRNSFLERKIDFPEERWIVNAIFFSKGFLSFSSDRPCSQETIQLLERFTNVFDGTYTRFLDLKNAEAQAREAQVQTSLERVRASAMAMHKSEDLLDVCETMYKEFLSLGFTDIRNALINIFDTDNSFINYDYGELTGKSFNRFSNDILPFVGDIIKTSQSADDAFSESYISGETLTEFKELRKHSAQKDDVRLNEATELYFYFYSIGIGSIGISTFEKINEEKKALLRRFRNVFNLSYQRYVDINKAEEQARESQIQLALERIRAATMAMQKSEELLDVITIFSEQLAKLNIDFDTVSFGVNSATDEFQFWLSSKGQPQPIAAHVPPIHNPAPNRVIEAQKKGTKFFADNLTQDESKRWVEHLISHSEIGSYPDKVKNYLLNSVGLARSTFLLKNINLYIANFKNISYTEEENNIFKRFAETFEQSYTRFLDLQKAEAQAREARIETSLERVRSRTMAMHNSDDVTSAIEVMFHELANLGIPNLRCGITNINEDQTMEVWGVTNMLDGKTAKGSGWFDTNAHPIWRKLFKGWKEKEEYISGFLGGKEKEDYFKIINSNTNYLSRVIEHFPDTFFNAYYFGPGAIWNYSLEPHSDEDKRVMKRFASVFSLTFRRYKDLQRAEAQAREAQIEASLERVRSKTMAMHNSQDVGDTVATMFAEFVNLGIHTNRCGILIFNDDTTAEVWTARSNTEGKATLIIGWLNLRIHKLLSSVYDAWRAKETFYQYKLVGDDLIRYYEAINNAKFYPTQFDLSKLGSIEFHSDFFFAEGAVFSFTNEVVSDEHSKIIKRFAAVFGQTYRRYLDLLKAEAQAREAQIEASLERVRAKTMAMQHSEELKQAAALLFQQIKALGAPAYSCGYNIWEKDEKVFTSWMSTQDGSDFNAVLDIPLTEDANFIRFAESRNKGESFFVLELKGERMQEHYHYLKTITEFKAWFDYADSMGFALPETQIHHIANFSRGNLLFITLEPCPEFHDVFKRFAAVFEQTYTRFLDLQKAETQAREATIEASLEKVRSSAMAMHNSNDISSTTNVVFSELKKLGIHSVRCGVGLLTKNSLIADLYAAATSADGETATLRRKVSMSDHRLLMEQHECWIKQENYIHHLHGEELNVYYRLPFFYSSPNYVPPEDHGQSEWGYYIPFSEGLFYSWNDTTYSESELNILNRFKAIIELTFRRYLDLQKAETQAREAQIEVALEKVRSKAMAMHKSEDLNGAVAIVFEELDKLNLGVLRCGISVLNKEKRVGDIWVTSTTDKGSAVQISGDESFDIHPLLQGAFEAWLRQEDFYYELEGDDLTAYYKAVKAANFQLPESQMVSSEKEFKKQYCNVAVYHAGGLFAFQEKEFTEEAKKVMKRFANVFDLTYKRFLDLQKAEAQAREAQIEASLERIRARTMAMHRSDELVDTSAVLFHELKRLGVKTMRSGFGIYDLPGRSIQLWLTAGSDAKDEKSVTGAIPLDAHVSIQENFQAWSNKKPLMIHEFTGVEVKKYYQKVGSYMSLPAEMTYPDKLIFSAFFFTEGSLNVMSEVALSEPECALMIRFANVFGLTYRRFLDLQKAEENTREAQIEASLERVRGKAMAMNNTNDLSSATSIAFTELRKLGINPLRFGVGLLSKESRKALLYSAVSSEEGESLALVGWVMLKGHPVLEDIYQSWLKNEDIFPVLSGTQLKLYYEQLLSGLSVPSIPDWQKEEKQFGHFFPFSIGCLYAWSEKPFNDAEIKILKRFASIIDLTFRRYLDLQKSEANAREAVKQAALDRVRADIASMRTISDLDRITPLIWNELTILGVPFIRCGVFLMDEEQELIHTFLSTPDGKAIAAFHLPFATGENIPKVISNWQQKSIYTDHWDEEAFTAFANELVKQGVLTTTQQYLSTLPKEGFYLHFLPFLQGMLYVGSLEKLDDDQMRLTQAVADAFSTAYARYEDFNKLEAAKQQVERTLVDLKQAQQQLVQSEKMASLGELTAGIAHEIQNPLNFVNNFSEVSNELIDEMKEELSKGNKEDAIAIAEDVKLNLEKINHHGKRAGAIVKSMLQHSRSSAGKKELTDINALADEYLRLAYHGLRAKDKSFNAKFEVQLDDSIGKINVVPQDIGRVMLNLINNAFYAVTEKKKSVANGYEPSVTVTTKNSGDKISIIVNDNGNGIPQKLIDKIFQPFFTTKPTGEGTGLGLSLSYDIIKAHGGELKVNTKEGEGSEFFIQLPSS